MNFILLARSTSGLSNPILMKWTDIILGPALLTLMTTVGIVKARREYRTRFLTEEWHDLLVKLMEHPRFMNPVLTADYETAFTGEDSVHYGLIARMCVDYVDDVHVTGTTRKTRDWFKEAVEAFLRPHETWFNDHASQFRPDFVRDVRKVLATTQQDGR